MRDRTPVWRGDDAFRATSWVDGSAAARAEASEGNASAQLSTGVNSDEIEKLFSELAWALRSARRA